MMQRPEILSVHALEAFVSRCLDEAHIWPARTSDGVAAFRAAVDEPTHLCVWLKLWHIDQTLHVACVDLRAGDGAWHWQVFLDPQQSANPDLPFRARQLPHLYDLLADPAEAIWEHEGRGSLRSA